MYLTQGAVSLKKAGWTGGSWGCQSHTHTQGVVRLEWLDRAWEDQIDITQCGGSSVETRRTMTRPVEEKQCQNERRQRRVAVESSESQRNLEEAGRGHMSSEGRNGGRSKAVGGLGSLVFSVRKKRMIRPFLGFLF